MEIKPTDSTIRTLLSTGQYTIPRFQRPYSWTSVQVDEFWEDVIASDDEEYFIGSFVMYSGSHEQRYIVDGQQRLTTVTLILAALRNAYLSIDLENKAHGVQTFVEGVDVNNDHYYRLKTEASYPYLQHVVQANDKPGDASKMSVDERSIERAFAFLSSNVDSVLRAIDVDTSISKEAKVHSKEVRLDKMRDRVLSLKLISILLDSEDDAYLIFETLNTRGKDLGVSDLLKNHFTRLIRAKNKGADSAKASWEKMRNSLETAGVGVDPNQFIYHWWISRNKYTGAGKVFKEAKKKIKAANASDELKGLVGDAIHYQKIVNPKSANWPNETLFHRRIRESLLAMNVFKVKQPIPMVLAILRSLDENKIKAKKAQETLEKLEKFHAQFTGVTSQRTGGGTARMYASSALELEKASDIHSANRILSSFVDKLRERVPSFDEFDANLKELFYADDFTRDRPVLRYLLIRYDAHFRSGAPVTYADLTIEHVASQRPNDKSGNVPNARIGTIGNLILITEGAQTRAANKSFLIKKEVYEKDKAVLDDSIREARSWGDREIEARGLTMSKALYNTILKI